MRRKVFQEEKTALIDLTPLIDVVFVVLIAFIIIAPLLEVDKVSLANSSKTTIENIEKNQIRIYVKEDESIWIGEKKIFLKNLYSVLQNLKKRYPMKKIQLYHDKKASFGLYQNIKKTAELSGYDNIDVILKKDEGLF